MSRKRTPPRQETEATVSAAPTPAQELTISALVAGATVTEAAAKAGVTRETVHRWRRDDVKFIAAWNRARAELREAARAELRALAGDAVRVLGRLLRSKTTPPAVRRKIALDVLGGVGLTEPDPPISVFETDAEALHGERVKAERDWKKWSAMRDGAMPTRLTVPFWAPLDTEGPEGTLVVPPDPLAELSARLKQSVAERLARGYLCDSDDGG